MNCAAHCHCGKPLGTSTAGCMACTSQGICAHCRALLSCSCGVSVEHKCPNITIVGGTGSTTGQWGGGT